EVGRDGIARKSIHNQQVKPLAGFPFERASAVAEHKLHPSRRIGDKSEIRLRETNHVGIKLVEANAVAGFSVSGERARTQPNRTDIAVRPGGQFAKSQPQSFFLAVVSRWDLPSLGV